MDDFRISSTPRYDAYHEDQRPADSNRKRAKRPKDELAEDEVLLEYAAADGDTADAQDCYTPSVRTGESE